MSVDVNLITILQKTISSEKNELVAAQNFLEEAGRADLPGLLKELSNVLASPTCDQIARMQAGLQLKNALYSKDPSIKSVYQQRWLEMPREGTAYIRAKCLEALGTETTRHSSAAQCVAYIACTELPAGNWPELMTKLVENVVNVESTENLKHATLETIGYICQDIDQAILASQSNEILTAIVCGMKKEEPSEHVRLAATNALFNSLEFTKHNFDIEHERNYIMQVVCESTQSEDTQIKVSALQCLVKIMSLYYQYMELYMTQALFPITLSAMKSDVPDVALQGIEFWSTVSDEELDLTIEASECYEKGQPPPVSSKYYAKGALQYIVPLLMQTLAKQDESIDEDEWNPSKAAGVCLMLLAQCSEDAIVDLVIPFVKGNIENPDWRLRDAAVMSFGSILEGPNPSSLKPLVESAMPVIIKLLSDPSAAVRDTAAWTIGRVCELLPEVVLTETFLVPLLNGLTEGLEAEPRVAANVCWAFSSLADSAYEAASGEGRDDDTDVTEPQTYALSQYFSVLTERMLAASSRPDGAQYNLRNAAYSALMSLMRSAARDCYGEVRCVTVIVLERLESVLAVDANTLSTQDRAQYNDLQSLLCATLQSVLRKIDKQDAPALADEVMTALLSMFISTSKPVNALGAGDQGNYTDASTKSAGNTGVQEDALLAVAALVDVLGEGFLKYLDAFIPILVTCLQNCSESQICLNAIGLLSDLCRVLSKHMLPHCNQLIMILIETLQNTNADKSVRPAIISAFGDLSMALGNSLVGHLPVIMEILKLASQAEVDLTDPDMVDYLNNLWNSCLDAYSGTIQGLKGEDNQPSQDLQHIAQYVPFILTFVEYIGANSISNDDIISSSCGLIGDLVSAFGSRILCYVGNEAISAVLTKGRRAKGARTRGVALWATKEIRKLQNMANEENSTSQATDQSAPTAVPPC